MPSKDGSAYSDYGLISTFHGPGDGIFLVIAGTRDMAVQQMSDIATSGVISAEAWRKAGQRTAFEALYEVSAMDKTDVTGRLLVAAPIDSARIWQVAGGPARNPALPPVAR